MSTRSRMRSQDGFIREVVWIVVILAVIAVVILDGMAIFNTYQSTGNTSSDAAQAALTEYAQSQNVSAAKVAAGEQLSKNGLTMVGFKVSQSPEGNTRMTVTAMVPRISGKRTILSCCHQFAPSISVASRMSVSIEIRAA